MSVQGPSPPQRSDLKPSVSRWMMLQSFYGYRAAFISADLIAGLTLAAIAVPEQMATARLAGFPPQIGFIAFIAGSLAFAIFGASRVLSSGADSTIAPIFAGTLGMLAAANSPQYASLAGALAIMVGALVVAAGLLRLDRLADLLSLPVMIGFLIGVAAHIAIGQLPSLLGLSVTGDTIVEKAAQIAAHIDETNLPTLAIGGGVFLLVILCDHISTKIPGALIGLAAAMLAVIFMRLPEKGVAVVGEIDAALPSLHIPKIGLQDFVALASLSFVLGLVIMVQTAATTRSFPSNPNGEPDLHRDVIGVGAGSMLAGLIGAFPVNASPPRSATVFETGGRSQVAGLFAAALVFALSTFGGALFRYVPTAALAGVLMFISLRLIRLKQMIQILRQSSREFLLIVATAAAIILLPIELGTAVGIVLSLLQGIWTTTRARIILFEQLAGTSIWWPIETRGPTQHQPSIIVLGFQAPLTFLNADNFRHDVETRLREAPDRTHLIVIEATGILDVDFTAAQMLREVIANCRAQEIDFAMARLESLRAQDALQRFGLMDLIGRDHIFHSVDEAVHALAPASAP